MLDNLLINTIIKQRLAHAADHIVDNLTIQLDRRVGRTAAGTHSAQTNVPLYTFDVWSVERANVRHNTTPARV